MGTPPLPLPSPPLSTGPLGPPEQMRQMGMGTGQGGFAQQNALTPQTAGGFAQKRVDDSGEQRNTGTGRLQVRDEAEVQRRWQAGMGGERYGQGGRDGGGVYEHDVGELRGDGMHRCERVVNRWEN